MITKLTQVMGDFFVFVPLSPPMESGRGAWPCAVLQKRTGRHLGQVGLLVSEKISLEHPRKFFSIWTTDMILNEIHFLMTILTN